MIGHVPPNSTLQRTAIRIKCSAAGGRAKSAHKRWHARVLRNVIAPSLSLIVRRPWNAHRENLAVSLTVSRGKRICFGSRMCLGDWL